MIRISWLRMPWLIRGDLGCRRAEDCGNAVKFLMEGVASRERERKERERVDSELPLTWCYRVSILYH